jgi:hypothetical protein
MSQYVIQADQVDFKNRYVAKDIILKHSLTGFDLVFGSEVKFKYNAVFQSFSLGKFEVKLSTDGETLEIRKNDNILMRLSED